MKKRIFASIISLTVGGILLTLVLVSFVTYYGYFSEMKDSVKRESLYVAAALQNDSDYLDSLVLPDKDSRITLIEADGDVLYDSRKSAETMDNHLTRPEIVSAQNNGVGEATRFSDTFGENTYYYAVKLDDGRILRVSDTASNALSALLGNIPLLIPIFVFLEIAAVYIAQKLTNLIVAPVNNINLSDPLSNSVYDEFAPLLRKIDTQNNEIKYEIHKSQKQQKEFSSVNEKMNEGIIVLGEKGNVLSINQAACKIFSCLSKDVCGENYVMISRDEKFCDGARRAMSGESVEEKLDIFGRVYQMMANAIYDDDEINVSGAVILILDITEKYRAEQQRREFSANVSHELKTPLTSISGYAEIIENGIAKKEDIPRFANMIHSEAKRLIALIEDIIKISHLDEKNIPMEAEDVDLYDLCDDVLKKLQSRANQDNISLKLNGDHISVKGVKRLLFEMVYNLCDNGIKYNKAGGTLTLSVVQSDKAVQLIVSDTGIGIPKEHQSRVFERFYRVDKSHSKETGGTGLGLSIVKNAALFHNAKIDLESTEGIGSKFTITF